MKSLRPEPQYFIVRLDNHDIDEIARVHTACFEEAWNARILTKILAMPGAFAIGVRPPVDGGNLVGFAIARIAADKCELLSLAVMPSSRNQGLGALILDAALTRAGAVKVRNFFLEVAENNHAALKLYDARGLVRVGRRQRYYDNLDGSFTDALTLQVDLSGIMPS